MAELSGGAVLSDAISAAGSTGRTTTTGGLAWAGGLLLLAPVAENRQAGGGVLLDGRGNRSVLAAYRLQQDFADPSITTHLELGLLVDVRPAVAVGPRVGAGVGYEFARGWRGGVALGVAVTAVHVRMALDLALSAAYLF